MSVKYPVIVTDDYVIWAEPFCDRIWIHVDVFRWSASVKRKYQIDFKRLTGPLYAANTAENKALLAKFMLMTGWHFYEKRDFGNGITYDVYRRL